MDILPYKDKKLEAWLEFADRRAKRQTNLQQHGPDY